MLEKLVASDKHSTLSRQFVNYVRKKFYKIGTNSPTVSETEESPVGRRRRLQGQMLKNIFVRNLRSFVVG
jgi:hypothetical protein